MPDTFAPGIGHNNPPDPITELQSKLTETHKAISDRSAALIASFKRSPTEIADGETANKVADLIKLIGACEKDAEAARVKEKAPWLAGASAVDGWFKLISDPLKKDKNTLLDRLTIWQRKVADDERKAREAEAKRQQEEADRKAKEAAEAETKIAKDDDLDAAIAADAAAKQAAADAEKAKKDAEAKAAELSRSRSAIGSVASLATFWDFKDLDREKIDLNALRPYLSIPDIEKAVRGYVKANFAAGRPGQQIAGVTIFENTRSGVR